MVNHYHINHNNVKADLNHKNKCASVSIADQSKWLSCFFFQQEIHISTSQQVFFSDPKFLHQVMGNDFSFFRRLAILQFDLKTKPQTDYYLDGIAVNVSASQVGGHSLSHSHNSYQGPIMVFE